MITSTISEYHHYYVAFFKAPTIKDVDGIYSLLGSPKSFEEIAIEDNKETVLHVQVDIKRPRPYGNEKFLKANENKKTGGVWYDFFIGKMTVLGVEYFYACYPYALMGKYIENCFAEKGVKRIFVKPQIQEVLSYLKKKQTKGRLRKVDFLGLETDIVKYSARIAEETNAHKVNIIGKNPLNSRVYDILESEAANGISLETTSLKLMCTKPGFYSSEVAFDKLGNCRFWLPGDKEKPNMFYLFSYILNFFIVLNATVDSSFISSYNLLDNEG